MTQEKPQSEEKTCGRLEGRRCTMVANQGRCPWLRRRSYDGYNTDEGNASKCKVQVFGMYKLVYVVCEYKV